MSGTLSGIKCNHQGVRGGRPLRLSSVKYHLLVIRPARIRLMHQQLPTGSAQGRGFSSFLIVHTANSNAIQNILTYPQE